MSLFAKLFSLSPPQSKHTQPSGVSRRDLLKGAFVAPFVVHTGVEAVVEGILFPSQMLGGSVGGVAAEVIAVAEGTTVAATATATGAASSSIAVAEVISEIKTAALANGSIAQLLSPFEALLKPGVATTAEGILPQVQAVFNTALARTTTCSQFASAAAMPLTEELAFYHGFVQGLEGPLATGIRASLEAVLGGLESLSATATELLPGSAVSNYMVSLLQLPQVDLLTPEIAQGVYRAVALEQRALSLGVTSDQKLKGLTDRRGRFGESPEPKIQERIHRYTEVLESLLEEQLAWHRAQDDG